MSKKEYPSDAIPFSEQIKKLRGIKDVVITVSDKESGSLKEVYLQEKPLVLENGHEIEVSIESFESEAKYLLHDLLQKVRSKLSADYTT